MLTCLRCENPVEPNGGVCPFCHSTRPPVAIRKGRTWRSTVLWLLAGGVGMLVALAVLIPLTLGTPEPLTLPSGSSLTPPLQVNSFVWRRSPPRTHGVPTLLFVGALYCPYCAAERWAVVQALQGFGQFSLLRTTITPDMDGYKAIATYDFSHMRYHSRYLAFSGKELADQFGFDLDRLTPTERAFKDRYDSGNGIPFTAVNGEYTESGTGLDPAVVAGHTAAYIQEQLRHHSQSSIARAIVDEATTISALICLQTAMRPTTICGQPSVHLLLYSA